MSRYDEQHTYIVEGRGEFPFDMLRHEQAWPADTTSALSLNHTDKRRIAITAQRARFIAPARWESFGWKIVEGYDVNGVGPCDIDCHIVGVFDREDA